MSEYNANNMAKIKDKIAPTSEENDPDVLVQHESKSSVRNKLLASVAIISVLVTGTIFMVMYAKGYRLFVNQGAPKVSKTGILHITNNPTTASIYIDGHLTTASNNSINLNPSKYNVKVTKDGYNDWQKDVQIQTEVVTSVDATLFPKSPTLQSISTFGVEEALSDPTGAKLAFKIASQSARKNGIYIFDMTARALPILQGQSSSNQIADDTTDKFSAAHLSWSPDSKQLLASISATPISASSSASETPIPATPEVTYYLLKTDSLNDTPQDVTTTISDVLSLWNAQKQDKEKARIKSLKPKIAKFATEYFHLLSWSPDDTKILYQASESGQMPVFLTPRRIGNNLLYERRDLKKGAIYVYDTLEDINTRIVDTIEEEPTFSWFPDSDHLLYVHDKKIQIAERDGSNLTTVYAGPFIGNYVFPWPDGSKLVILTNLGNPSVSPTLYTIGLK